MTVRTESLMYKIVLLKNSFRVKIQFSTFNFGKIVNFSTTGNNLDAELAILAIKYLTRFGCPFPFNKTMFYTQFLWRDVRMASLVSTYFIVKLGTFISCQLLQIFKNQLHLFICEVRILYLN